VIELALSEENLRRLLELSRQLVLSTPDQTRGKRYVLDCLCRLVQAVRGVAALLDDDFTVVGDVTVVNIYGTDVSASVAADQSIDISPRKPFDPIPIETTLRELERPHPDAPNQPPADGDPQSGARIFGLDNPLVKPFIQEAAKRNLEPTALARVEAIVDRQWYRSAFFRRFLAPMGLDDCILSIVPLPGLQPFIAMVCLSGPLTRPVDRRGRDGQPFFTPRQRRIVEITHGQLRWIYYPQRVAAEQRISPPLRIVYPTGSSPDGLAPRYQRVLNHLLGGGSEKELASYLGLSRFTIHEYIRAIYRKLNVNSRSELMARWVQPTPPAMLAS
jgi:DNA-binding CsgD family transcriptional regulator